MAENKLRIIGVIPARYASTRFPGKVLAEICGRTMIEWVYRGAKEASLLDEVIIATDEDIVAMAASKFGARVEMTRGDHKSGTDRIGEVAECISADYYVNIQGDEPLIRGVEIDKLVKVAVDESVEMGTLAYSVASIEKDVKTIEEPSTVKVVTDKNGYALYFSRFPIPFPRSIVHAAYKVHVGIYIYRRDVLLRLCKLERTPLEIAESLEQLRALENGIRIRVLETDYRPIGVDTPLDLKRAENALRKTN